MPTNPTTAPEDVRDEATGMSPREAAELLADFTEIKLSGNATAEDVLEDPVLAGDAIGWLRNDGRSGYQWAEATLRNWHAAKAAADWDAKETEFRKWAEDRRVQAIDDGFFNGIQLAKVTYELGGENALRKLVQDEREKRLNAVLAAKPDTQQGEREGGNGK